MNNDVNSVMNFTVNQSEMLIQGCINTASLEKVERMKLNISLYNDQKTGQSKIYAWFGAYAPMVLNLNHLQLKYLMEYAKDGVVRQIFPLSQEDVDSATEADLQPVENLRINVLKEIVASFAAGKGKGFGRLKVYPYNNDANKMDLRVHTPYATLNFYIDKSEEVVAELRRLHMIL